MIALLALPLLLDAQGPPASGDLPPGVIAFQLRLVDCETLSWRSQFQPRLKFGGHRAGSSAWIADEATMTSLTDHFTSSDDCQVVAAPKVLANPGDPAIIGTSTTRHFVVHAEPADAGPNAETKDASPETDGAILPRPVVAPIDDGAQVRLVGRPESQGMHLQVQVIDSRVAAVHVIEAPAEAGGGVIKVQVPEVSRREMGGEWLVPKEHGLILSLGVESAPAQDGKSAVRERLLLISPSMTGGLPSKPAVDARITRAQSIPKAAVVVPSPLPPTAQPAVPLPTTAVSPTAPALVVRTSGVPTALAATPWGLLPIFPVEVVPSDPAVVGVSAPAIPAPALPALPSRNLPRAIDREGRAVDPRTEKDREAEQTDSSPFVDGEPVPSPQVTTPQSASSDRPSPGPDLAVRPTSAEAPSPAPEEPRSVFKVRLSFGLSRGLSVDVDLGDGDRPATASALTKTGPTGDKSSDSCEAIRR
ncbi:hypothetical protein [Tautonia sociabilis]|uniref:Uncharacterized protein n=1 Tax=Tautonia sociabilis TaxID=2080755 RepID=A0A432MM11_9BACT|nr:hypothetical protein [Tautonia sociabilis]RUL88474.1 hypothetical protein TsocGM_07100 [Tautonia sociabilis]